MKIILLVACCLPVLAGCQKKPGGAQAAQNPVTVLVSPAIAEASGIGDSRTNENALWVIEDSGNPPQLLLLGHDGKVKNKLPLPNATNRDWEDIAVSEGYVYVGDIGDNNQKYASYKIYKAPEPAAGASEVTAVETISFAYPDGAHDAEAFLVAPQSGDIYVITKRDSLAQVYKIAAPYSTTSANVAEKVGQLSFTNVVSASLAPDGGKLIVKTYDAVYQYPVLNKEPIAAALKHVPSKLPYQTEPQGEAVCFKRDGSGYFTLSEQFMGKDVQLYFYKQ